MTHPQTESTNPNAMGIDILPVRELLDLILKEELASIGRMHKALPDIERAVDDAVQCLRKEGVIYYAGAGTSGRLGVLDSSEIPPTFGRDSFRAFIAGGLEAVHSAVEGAEDDIDAGRTVGATIGPSDMAIGIAASGRTPYVRGFLESARKRGARTWLITCNNIDPYPYLDGLIFLDTGPEIIAGSTRMKAATATKIALNMLSTSTMIRMGGVYDGLMVDVMPTNVKLVARALSIIRQITSCTPEESVESLKASGMRPKVAALMRAKCMSRDDAELALEKNKGSLRKALGK